MCVCEDLCVTHTQIHLPNRKRIRDIIIIYFVILFYINERLIWIYNDTYSFDVLDKSQNDQVSWTRAPPD